MPSLIKDFPADKYLPNTIQSWPDIQDLYIFINVVRYGSFSNTASNMGVTTSHISKHIAALEKAISTKLFFRNHNTITLTAEGENAFLGALMMVNDMDSYINELTKRKGNLEGELTISCSLGFGQKYLADALSAFMKCYPNIHIKLVLSDKQVDLVKEGIDIEIYVGNDIKNFYVARQIAKNRRILCASPAYLSQYNFPTTLSELKEHHFLVIQERNNTFGHLLLTNGQEQVNLQVNHAHSSNSGNIILAWALQDHGVILRSYWHVAAYIQTGQLIHILPEWYQQADIWAVSTQRPSHSHKISICVDFLNEYFKNKIPSLLNTTNIVKKN